LERKSGVDGGFSGRRSNGTPFSRGFGSQVVDRTGAVAN